MSYLCHPQPHRCLASAACHEELARWILETCRICRQSSALVWPRPLGQTVRLASDIDSLYGVGLAIMSFRGMLNQF